MARGVMRQLADGGYDKVRHHSTWTEAERSLEDVTFDAAVVDVHLAESPLDGIEIGLLLNARYELPIVVTTGYTDERTLTRLAALPYAQYVHKPFTGAQLLASLRRVIKAAPPRRVVAVPAGDERAAAAARSGQLSRARDEIYFVRANGRRIDRIDFARVCLLAADRAYTDVHLADGTTRTLDFGLRAALREFGRDDLLQVHKSFAVPYHAIARATRDDLTLVDGRTVPVGRTYRKRLRELLLRE